jgi:hypothetical protein
MNLVVVSPSGAQLKRSRMCLAHVAMHGPCTVYCFNSYCRPYLPTIPLGIRDTCVSFGSPFFHACTVVSAVPCIHVLSQQCMCYMSRPLCSLCALCMLSVYSTCGPTGCLLTTVGERPAGKKAAKAAVCCLVILVRRGLGPTVILGVARSRIDRYLGLPAQVVPACCTGGLHCINCINCIIFKLW